MPFTYTDLVEIDRAIASGATKVQYQDRTVEYNSVSELLKARSAIISALPPGSIPGLPGGMRRQIRMITQSGF